MFEVEIEHSGLPSNSSDIAESLNFEGWFLFFML